VTQASALQVVGARNLHKRVCILACGDCALKRVKPGLEPLSPPAHEGKRRDDLHTNHTGANTWRCFIWSDHVTDGVFTFGTLWTPGIIWIMD